MRKRIAIAGHADEGLALILLLETNPDIEVCAIVSDDREAALAGMRRIEASLPARFADRITSDLDSVLRTPGLTAIIDAEPSPEIRDILSEASDRGIQVSSPLAAKLLYAFGPVDATRKPDLLQMLGEILESYNLTTDRRGLLNRILQIAVGATGADRGSLMLIDPSDGCLIVDVAIGIEKELIPKIRIRSGEGISGRAFADRRAILLKGKADRERYDISRERDDVESAISAPLIHDSEILGVLNLSHARQRGAFTEEDLEFVEQLARIDAKIIARAEEYHTLLRDSTRLHAQTAVREILSLSEPLTRRLAQVCRRLAEELSGGMCHIYIHDPDLDRLSLQASSAEVDPLASPLRVRMDEGLHGWVARTRKPVLLSRAVGHTHICFAVLPLVEDQNLIGLLAFEGASETAASELLREKITAFAEALSEELHDALRDLRIERDATKASAITEFATRVSGSLDSAELHRVVTSAAAMILEAEHAVLRLQDPDSGRFQIRSYFGSADTEAQAQLFTLEKDLSIDTIKRRLPLRIVDLDRRAEFRGRSDIRSALVQPLSCGGRVCGTLSVLGKMVHDPLGGESFSAADEKLLVRFGEHVGRALEHVTERERARHHQRFDSLTALPNTAHLRERLEQEIVRCSGRGRTFALIRLQIDGLGDLLSRQEEVEGDRLVLSVAQDLRAALREFDILARTEPDTFHILIPEPDVEISALLGPLARRARESIEREPGAPLGKRAELRFGYALFPEEGQTVKMLLERVTQPRITSE